MTDGNKTTADLPTIEEQAPESVEEITLPVECWKYMLKRDPLFAQNVMVWLEAKDLVPIIELMEDMVDGDIDNIELNKNERDTLEDVIERVKSERYGIR